MGLAIVTVRQLVGIAERDDLSVAGAREQPWDQRPRGFAGRHAAVLRKRPGVGHNRVVGARFHLPPAATVEIEILGDPLNAFDNRVVDLLGSDHDEPGCDLRDESFEGGVVIRGTGDFILERQALADVHYRRDHQSLLGLLDKGHANFDVNLGAVFTTAGKVTAGCHHA